MGGMNTKRFRADVDVMTMTLKQLGERSERAILAVMREEGENIATMARAFAPVDTEGLEESIQVQENRDGINRRTQVTVGVDEDHINSDGREVGQYALEMHEGLAPFGSGAFKLGPRSKQKDGGSGTVGGKFIERAVRSRVGIIGKRIKAITERIFR